jgi:3-phosphoshikimate 1-carboxyvinyltransferase
VKVFKFKGRIPASKSLMNRALIAQSFEPRLKLLGDSSCDDVVHMKASLKKLGQRTVFDCGEGGTTLRFMAFRISRMPGSFLLKGTPRLLSRPQTEIRSILHQLGVQVSFEKKGIRIVSSGWRAPVKAVAVSAKDSSQFLSALFLNAWNLDFDLKIKVSGAITSAGYFEMTLQLLQEMGLKYSRRGSIFTIPRGQKIKLKRYSVESDLSSLFSVAAFAAVSGQATFQDFPAKSLQPDLAFTGILKKMGVVESRKTGQLAVKAPKTLKAVKANLQNSPDLFPVLAALCSFAKGRSVLYGAPQLAVKESNRIEKTAELLKKAGVRVKERKDGMEIEGRGASVQAKRFRFDPDKDHRLAFAAALLKYFGEEIQILDPDVVRKSFPEFWKYVGVRP